MRNLRNTREQHAEPTWFDSAGCRHVGPHHMFPTTSDGERAAKAVCAGCPVRSECRTYALAQEELHGVWGGMTEDERRTERMQAIRAGRSAADAPPDTVRFNEHMPTTPWGWAIREVLADGEWHVFEELVAAVRGVVPPERSLHAFNRENKARSRDHVWVATGHTHESGCRLITTSIVRNMRTRKTIVSEPIAPNRFRYRLREPS